MSLSGHNVDAMIAVHVEAGKKRVFATAIDWPGWSRCANDENGTIAAVVDYGARYQTAVRKRMALPGSVTDVRVVSRARGGADTDFGVPGLIPGDDEPVDARQLKQLVALLQRCWDAFDAAAAQAKA